MVESLGCRSSVVRASLLLWIGGAAACGPPYALLRSALDLRVQDRNGAQITATAAYQATVGRVTRVAVRAPDECVSFSVSGATGQASVQTVQGSRGQSAQVLHNRCGVEMGELENALARAGYVVSSWTAVRDLGGAPVEAARRLGAQVLFQVNSLEQVRQSYPARDVRREREFYRSNQRGDELEPMEPTTRDRRQFVRLLGREEERYLTNRIGAAFDLNAVWVETGQTIWFYQRTEIEPLRGRTRAEVLAVRRDDAWVSTQRAGGRERERDREEDENASREIEGESTQARPEDEVVETYGRLRRLIVADFVQQFQGGQPVPSGGPAQASSGQGPAAGVPAPVLVAGGAPVPQGAAPAQALQPVQVVQPLQPVQPVGAQGRPAVGTRVMLNGPAGVQERRSGGGGPDEEGEEQGVVARPHPRPRAAGGPHFGLLVAGTVTFGVGYVGNAIVGIALAGTRGLGGVAATEFIPVLGPIIGTALFPPAWFGLLLDGFQLAGGGMFIGAYTTGARPAPRPRAREALAMPPVVMPVLSPGYAGASVTFVNF